MTRIFDKRGYHCNTVTCLFVALRGALVATDAGALNVQPSGESSKLSPSRQGRLYQIPHPSRNFPYLGPLGRVLGEINLYKQCQWAPITSGSDRD